MKIKVNRNTIWAKIFVDQLAELGVRYACISPGSRSTPLTYSLAKNRKIKSYINIDERSSAFFALGLAKSSGKPTIIVTTSGTAVAELYPAIIESYQQRVPLIICTADRPPQLIGTGANQTINQQNIFKNHIRWFRDIGLPSISETGFRHLQKIGVKAFQICSIEDKGPVHLNFPFRKPLEPFSYTDEINKKLHRIKPLRHIQSKTDLVFSLSKSAHKITEQVVKNERGIIIVGPMAYNLELNSQIKKLSKLIKYPIFADGLSHLRFGASKSDNNIIVNFNSILSAENFIQKHDPEVILQFGRTPTSSVIENFFSETNADRYLINQFGDLFDPTRNAKATLACDPKIFCEYVLADFKSKITNRKKFVWLNDFIKADNISNKIKNEIIDKAKFPSEPSIINEVIDLIPSGSQVFVGNSLPVRDLDNFQGLTSKKLIFYSNRGASGIDGVSSTAFGTASRNSPTILITGDLSFLHDLNALMIAIKYSIPITIIVINNNGGGIFESLPIANKVIQFREFFITPHNLEFSNIVKSFGIDYQLITNRSKLQFQLNKSLNNKLPSLLEIKTNAVKSVELRNRYFNEVNKKLNKEFSK